MIQKKISKIKCFLSKTILNIIMTPSRDLSTFQKNETTTKEFKSFAEYEDWAINTIQDEIPKIQSLISDDEKNNLNSFCDDINNIFHILIVKIFPILSSDSVETYYEIQEELQNIVIYEEDS